MDCINELKKVVETYSTSENVDDDIVSRLLCILDEWLDVLNKATKTLSL